MTKKLFFTFAFVLFFNLGFAQGKGTLHIETSPNAGVWLNAWAVGSTPFSIDLPPGWVIYSMRLPGYWTEVYLANIEQNTEILHEVQLKKYGQTASEIPDVSKINDLRALESIYDNLAKQKIEAPPDSFCMARFVADYPMLISTPAYLSDSSLEYRNYYEIYINERQLSFNEWYANCTGSIQKNQNIILARINELKNKQLNGYAPIIAAEFEPTEPNGLKGKLKLYFYSPPDGRAEVLWKGTWENNFLTGDELVRALTASSPIAMSFLTTQNQTVWIPVEGGYSRHYYKYSNIYISWNGLLFPMAGEFILPDYIKDQPEVAEWLNAGKAMPQDTVIKDSIVEEQIPDKAMFAKIPGGTFKYKGKEKDIKPFTMNTSEINQGLYAAKCGEKDFGKKNKKYKGDSLPAHSVTWHEANSCCIALGGELPTEAEWEYAARAGSPHKYTLADGAKDYAVFGEKELAATAGKKPNGWGLYDMFGNVAEWVKDDGFWFGKYKFIKGGSWKSKESHLSVEDSEEEDARYWGTHTGFRCVYR